MGQQTFLLLFAIVILALPGCNSTNHTGKLNPNYSNYTLRAPLIAVDGASSSMVEEKLTSELVAIGISATSLRAAIEWARNDEESQRIIDETNFGAVIFVNIGDDIDEVTVFQSHTSGSVQSYGNYGSYSGSTTTVPLRGISRDMAAGIEIRDCEDNPPRTFLSECSLIWKGATVRHAQGLAFTGTSQMVNHTVKGIVRSLREDGLIP